MTASMYHRVGIECEGHESSGCAPFGYVACAMLERLSVGG